MKIWNIRLDYTRKFNNIDHITVVQNDLYAYKIVAVLLNNGKPITIEDANSIMMSIDKPNSLDDFSILGNVIDKEGAVVEFDLPFAAMNEIGLCTVSIKNVDPNYIMTMPSFTMEVLEDPAKTYESHVTDSENYPILTQLVTEVTGIKDVEANRVDAENTRAANETTRQGNETNRSDNEVIRENNELDRIDNEAIREDNENVRVSNESDRELAEINREAAEAIRETQEQDRINTFNTNEANRESTSSTNETNRENTFNTNETQRQSEFDSAEAARATNETNREAAEATRETNEGMRKTSEDERVSNESIRQYNESVRETNETERQTEETKRINNETNRQIAEIQRANEFEAAQVDRDNTFKYSELNRSDIFSSNENKREANEVVRQDNEEARQGRFATMESEFDSIVSSGDIPDPFFTDLLKNETSLFTVGTGVDTGGANITDGSNVVKGQVSDVRIKGKTRTNLIPTFDNWDEDANISIESPTRVLFTNSSGTANTYNYNNLKVKPNTTYTAKINAPDGGGFIIRKQDGSVSYFNVSENYEETFTTDSETTEIYIRLYTVSEGTYVFENLILEEGDTVGNFITGTNPKSTVSGTLVSRSKNLFDGELELGLLNLSTGFPSISDTQIRTKNFIKVTPNLNYNLKSFSGLAIRYYCYDKDKNHIGNYYVNSDFTFKTPNECYYIKWISTSKNISELYQLEIGTQATTYEKYYPPKELTYKLPSTIDSLKSLPNGTNDEVKASEGKLIKRVEEHITQENDFGNVYTNSEGTLNYCSVYIPADSADVSISSFNFTFGNQPYGTSSHGNIWINNDRAIRLYLELGTTKQQAIDEFSGTTLTYQLATPIEHDIQVHGELYSFGEGTTIEYKPLDYVDTLVNLPQGWAKESLPNGVENYIVNDGKFVKNVNKKVLENNDVFSLYTSFTNLDLVLIYKPTNYIGYGSQSFSSINLTYKDYKWVYGSLQDNIDNIGKLSVANGGDRIAIGVPKGTYMSLTDAQNNLAGTSITYQLDTTENYDISINDEEEYDIYDTEGNIIQGYPYYMPKQIEGEGTTPTTYHKVPLNKSAQINTNTSGLMKHDTRITDLELEVANTIIELSYENVMQDLEIQDIKIRLNNGGL